MFGFRKQKEVEARHQCPQLEELCEAFKRRCEAQDKVLFLAYGLLENCMCIGETNRAIIEDLKADLKRP